MKNFKTNQQISLLLKESRKLQRGFCWVLLHYPKCFPQSWETMNSIKAAVRFIETPVALTSRWESDAERETEHCGKLSCWWLKVHFALWTPRTHSYGQSVDSALLLYLCSCLPEGEQLWPRPCWRGNNFHDSKPIMFLFILRDLLQKQEVNPLSIEDQSVKFWSWSCEKLQNWSSILTPFWFWQCFGSAL